MENSFIKQVLIRGLWTFCETLLSLIGGATFIQEISWKMVLSTSILAFIISILKSIVTGLPEYSNNNNTQEPITIISQATQPQQIQEPQTIQPEFYNLPNRKEN